MVFFNYIKNFRYYYAKFIILPEKDKFLITYRKKPLQIQGKKTFLTVCPPRSDINWGKITRKSHQNFEKYLYIMMILLGYFIFLGFFALLSYCQNQNLHKNQVIKLVLAIALAILQFSYSFVLLPLKLKFFFKKLCFFSFKMQEISRNLCILIGNLLISCVFCPLFQRSKELFFINANMYWIITSFLFVFVEIVSFFIKKKPLFDDKSCIILSIFLLLSSLAFVTCTPLSIFLALTALCLQYIIRKCLFKSYQVKSDKNTGEKWLFLIGFWLKLIEISVFVLGLGSFLVEAWIFEQFSIGNIVLLAVSVVFMGCPMQKISEKIWGNQTE